MKVVPNSGTPVGPGNLAQRVGGATDAEFSICIMLTNWEEYGECLTSFLSNGFDEKTCEYIVLDNSDGNKADAYVALNEFLQASTGKYVIICHQDIQLIQHDRNHLQRCIKELDDFDPAWAVCGNAGCTSDGWPVICISHPHRETDIQGLPFPRRVVSLDENFLVIRRAANLALSRDLTGFHHYGPEICIIADILGWSCYVINFFLKHKSGGNFDPRYSESANRIVAKYQRALRSRWIFLITRRPFFISGTRVGPSLAYMQRKIGKAIGWYARDRDFENADKRKKMERIR